MIYELTIKRTSNGQVLAEVTTRSIERLYQYIADWKVMSRLTDYKAYVNLYYNNNRQPGDIPDDTFSIYPIEATLKKLQEHCWRLGR